MTVPAISMMMMMVVARHDKDCDILVKSCTRNKGREGEMRDWRRPSFLKLRTDLLRNSAPRDVEVGKADGQADT